MTRTLLSTLLLAALLGAGLPVTGTGAGAGRSAPFSLVVDLPASTPADEMVFLEVLGEEPARRLALLRDGKGRAHLDLDWPEDELLVFRFRRAAEGTQEVAPDGSPAPPRRLRPHAGGHYQLRVARWADKPFTSVVGNVEILRHEPFLEGRPCWIYLPPGYGESDRRYPVLYMLDGQNLFDEAASYAGEWRVDETLEEGIAAGTLPPVIVVGIENAGGRRLDEYTPWPDGAWRGGGAELFLKAVVEVLKPEIDRRYRTLPGPDHTYLAGSSLGGLFAAWVAWERPGVFGGGVAAVSPSYWWAGEAILDLARRRGDPGVRRFYQDMGTLESGLPRDDDGDGKEDAVARLQVMDSILTAAGRRPGVDLETVVGEGDRHRESAWARRLPGLLAFLLADE